MSKKENKIDFLFPFRVLTLQLCAHHATWQCLHETRLWKVSFMTDCSFIPCYMCFS